MAREGISKQVCEAVAEEINGNDWSIGVSAKRSRGDWDLRLSDSSSVNLRCDVVPVTYDDATLDNRDCINWVVPCHVVFRKLITQGDRDSDGAAKNSIIDPLEATVEEVFIHFFQQFQAENSGLSSFPAAAIAYEPRWLTLYGIFSGSGEGGTLRNLGQFTSGFELVFEVSEDL